MAKPKKKTYKSRKFLNKDQGIAAIETSFEFEPDWLYSGGWESHVVISDCSRNVRLDFSAYEGKDIDKSLDKLATLLTELEKLGNTMLEYREAAEEKCKEALKERKKRIKERANKARTLEEVVDDLDSE